MFELDLADKFLLNFIIISIIVIALVIIIQNYRKSPFEYPYHRITIDISRKRNVVYEKYIETYIKSNGINEFKAHLRTVEDWKKECQMQIDDSIFKKKRTAQFLDCIDDSNMFVFAFHRLQTRYKQTNYIRTPYKVFQCCHSVSMSFEDVKRILNITSDDISTKPMIDSKPKSKNPIRAFGWFWYLSGQEKLLNPDKCGKWMLFTKDQEFAKTVCSKAIKNKICYECKCSDIEKRKADTSVICLYQNGDDFENHKKIITFMIENELIRKTKTGKYYNLSFKYDSQTRNKEYGIDYQPKLSLADFIDLNTGKWIFDQKKTK